MWTLTIRSPGGEPRQYQLHPGANTIGRLSGNEIIVQDTSASRYHAQILYNPQSNTLVLRDLGSTNGTYINRDRVIGDHIMAANDVIRIGQHQLELDFADEKFLPSQPPAGLLAAHSILPLSRDLLLESLDQHAVLLAEAVARLNTQLNMDEALETVSALMKTSMGADRCEAILADDLDRLSGQAFSQPVARQAIQQRAVIVLQNTEADPALRDAAVRLNIQAAMCVPILLAEELYGLIFIYMQRQAARPFERRDLQLAIAISHHAGLAIQRLRLFEITSRKERVSDQLRNFLPPQEADLLLKQYLASGALPPIEEQYVTVLSAGICEANALAERIGARRFDRLLGQYRSAVRQVLFNYHALLAGAAETGQLAVFGLPNQPPAPEERAARAGLALLDRMDLLANETGEAVHIGIGAGTGLVMAGFAGNADGFQFSMVGWPVDIARSLEATAAPNSLLVSAATQQVIGSRLSTRPVGGEGVQAWEVVRAH